MIILMIQGVSSHIHFEETEERTVYWTKCSTLCTFRVKDYN